MAEYEYDIRGNRKVLRYPKAGLETNYSYNDGNRVMSLETKRQGVILTAWEYGYDVDGNLLFKTDKGSSPVAIISYCYDRVGRLVEENNPNWKRTLYSYDASSNRTKMMVEGRSKDELISVTNYEYDRNNRLEKETRKQGKITETYRYRYDDNGNETFRTWEKTSPTPDYPGTVRLSSSRNVEIPTVYGWRHYDGFNQLIRINQDEREITYQYRGDSLRHRSEVRNLTEGESRTNVLFWDGSDIAAELAEGEKIKSYLRGINLLAKETDRLVYYYIHNAHGDVVQLRTENGVCKVSYEYDAFGNERNPSREDKNPFRYCGEYFELSSGTYYLRARYYDPLNARMLSEDTFKGNLGSPLSLNLYIYCKNDPIQLVDWSGNSAVIAAIASGLVGVALGAIPGGFSAKIKGEKVLWGAVGGAAVAAVSMIPVAGPVLAGATAFANEMLQSKANDREFRFWDTAFSAVSTTFFAGIDSKATDYIYKEFFGGMLSTGYDVAAMTMAEYTKQVLMQGVSAPADYLLGKLSANMQNPNFQVPVVSTNDSFQHVQRYTNSQYNSYQSAKNSNGKIKAPLFLQHAYIYQNGYLDKGAEYFSLISNRFVSPKKFQNEIETIATFYARQMLCLQ